MLKRKNEIDTELRLDDEKPVQIIAEDEECEKDTEDDEDEYEREEFLEEEEIYV